MPEVTTAEDVLAEAERLLDGLRDDGDRLVQLIRASRALDDREKELDRREALIEPMEESLASERADLDEREVMVSAEEARLDRLARSLAADEAKLAAHAVELEEREVRFLGRWGWLARTWRHAWRRDAFQPCDLLFIPTLDGYRLLEQDGVALRAGSILTGLVDEQRTFVVTKIAPLPLDDRWCAYLQEAGAE